jgi:hypothetical protein
MVSFRREYFNGPIGFSDCSHTHDAMRKRLRLPRSEIRRLGHFHRRCGLVLHFRPCSRCEIGLLRLHSVARIGGQLGQSEKLNFLPSVRTLRIRLRQLSANEVEWARTLTKGGEGS